MFVMLALLICGLSCSQRDYTKVKTENYTFYLYNEIPQEAAQEISAYLDSYYQETLDLLLVEEMDTVEIHLWTDNEEFIAKQEEIFNLSQPSAAGFAHGHGVYMLYGGSLSNSVALHEFVHVVTEWVNPDIRDNPRWLWESVAVYGSNFPPVRPTLMSMITENNYPSMETLNADFDESTVIYTVGYTITEYIVERHGLEKLTALVQSGGDLQGVLVVTQEQFSLDWVTFLQEEYS